jgi:hypothetical protein
MPGVLQEGPIGANKSKKGLSSRWAAQDGSLWSRLWIGRTTFLDLSVLTPLVNNPLITIRPPEILQELNDLFVSAHTSSHNDDSVDPEAAEAVKGTTKSMIEFSVLQKLSRPL